MTDYQDISPSPVAGYVSANDPQSSVMDYRSVVQIVNSYQDWRFRKIQGYERMRSGLTLLLMGIPFAVGIGFALTGYLIASAVVTALLGGVSYYAWRKLNEWTAGLIQRAYHNIKENIYVYSLRPGDTTVNERARREAAALEAANNNSGAQVVRIHFAAGEHCNEFWNDPDEWPARLLTTVQTDRAARHAALRKDDPDWYDTYLLHQE